MPSTPLPHPVQLQELWVEQVDAARRQRTQEDPTEATLAIPRAKLMKGPTAREHGPTSPERRPKTPERGPTSSEHGQPSNRCTPLNTQVVRGMG